MKRPLLVVFLNALSLLSAVVQCEGSVAALEPPGGVGSVTVQVVMSSFAIVSPTQRLGAVAPTNIPQGAVLTISTGINPATISSITWLRDGIELSQSSTTLTINSADLADSGIYTARLVIDGSTYTTNPAAIRVIRPLRQQLLNISSRTTISPANPVLIAGFVVSPGAGTATEKKYVLLRAVGPTLANYGVVNPLSAPAIRLFRSDGTEVSLVPPAGVTLPTPSIVAEAVGAFPLAAGSADVALLVELPAGPYSAHAYSSNGGTGDILMEIYEIPAGFTWDTRVPN